MVSIDSHGQNTLTAMSNQFVIQKAMQFILHIGHLLRIFVVGVQQLPPLLDRAVELAATHLAELVRRPRMIRLPLLARQLQTIPLVLGRHLAIVDALLALPEHLRVRLHVVAEPLDIDAVLGADLLNVQVDLLELY